MCVELLHVVHARRAPRKAERQAACEHSGEDAIILFSGRDSSSESRHLHWDARITMYLPVDQGLFFIHLYATFKSRFFMIYKI
jgi:hypothetical protein